MLVFVALFLINNSRPSYQWNFNPEVSSLPTIYGITPTYARLVQEAELTRLSQTLMLVKNFHWVVIEDSETKTDLVANLLKESHIKYTHLNIKTHITKRYTAKGVEQRNIALAWLRDHLRQSEDQRGYVYFMDDDNTYSLKVFDEIRKIQRVGTWPVGIVGGMQVEMPIVTNGKVTGYNARYLPFRPFPIDMAGFAINATLFLEHPEAKFSREVPPGFQESEILNYFTTNTGLEPLADNCTKVYVWHTRTQDPSVLNRKILITPPDSRQKVSRESQTETLRENREGIYTHARNLTDPRKPFVLSQNTDNERRTGKNEKARNCSHSRFTGVLWASRRESGRGIRHPPTSCYPRLRSRGRGNRSRGRRFRSRERRLRSRGHGLRSRGHRLRSLFSILTLTPFLIPLLDIDALCTIRA